MYQVVPISNLTNITDHTTLTSSLDQSRSNVGDTKGGSVRRHNVPTDDRVDVDRDVVLGHDRLLGHRAQLDLDIYHPQVLGCDVDLDQPRID